MRSVLCCLYLFLIAEISSAQSEQWLRIIPRTAIAVKYFAPSRAGAFAEMEEKVSLKNPYGIVKHFSDGTLAVRLTFHRYPSHIEVSGDVVNSGDEDRCFTLKVVFPTGGFRDAFWGHDLDSTRRVEPSDTTLCNYVEACTVVPPAGAFNTDEKHNGGYGDKVGSGGMSFYPLASLSADGHGLGWGVDMGIPVVYRLSYEPSRGMVAEFDLALSGETTKFPGRAFFKLHLFEFNHEWHLRGALEKYYQLQAEYFKKRVPQEGIWLPVRTPVGNTGMARFWLRSARN